jgi:hypothetical protein
VLDSMALIAAAKAASRKRLSSLIFLLMIKMSQAVCSRGLIGLSEIQIGEASQNSSVMCASLGCP